MKFINQTDKVINKADGKDPKRKKPLIPGLSRIAKPKKAQKSADLTEKAINNKPVIETNDVQYPETPSLPQGSSIIQAELISFMEPLDPLMNSWELESFDINDALARDTQWLEGLEYINIPESPADRRRKEFHLSSRTPTESDTGHFEPVEPVGVHNEFRLACHYCSHLSRFYSVKNPEWNFYSAVNEEFAYRYSPLRYAILAWSSLHLSIIEGKETKLDTARKYHQLALRRLMSEDYATSKVPLDMLLVGSFFLCIYDIMAGEDQLKSILRHVWASLKLGSLFDEGSLPKLSPLGYQIITWLMYLDIRSALFVGNIQYPNYIDIGRAFYQKSTTNGENGPKGDGDVQYLLTSDLYEKRVVSDIYGNSRSVLKRLFGTRYPSSFSESDDSQDRILVVMVKNMLMFATLVRLRNWLSGCGNSLEFHPQMLRSKIEDLRAETEAIFKIAGKDSVSLFHVYVELALVNAVVIYFDRICNPDIRTSPESQVAASKIVEIAKSLKLLRAPGTPGSLQWPFPLVIAGIETLDPVHQSWVLNELEDNDEEGWGFGLKKARKVVREVMKRQNTYGRRVDLGEVMLEMGAPIII